MIKHYSGSTFINIGSRACLVCAPCCRLAARHVSPHLRFQHANGVGHFSHLLNILFMRLNSVILTLFCKLRWCSIRCTISVCQILLRSYCFWHNFSKTSPNIL